MSQQSVHWRDLESLQLCSRMRNLGRMWIPILVGGSKYFRVPFVSPSSHRLREKEVAHTTGVTYAMFKMGRGNFKQVFFISNLDGRLRPVARQYCRRVAFRRSVLKDDAPSYSSSIARLAILETDALVVFTPGQLLRRGCIENPVLVRQFVLQREVGRYVTFQWSGTFTHCKTDPIGVLAVHPPRLPGVQSPQQRAEFIIVENGLLAGQRLNRYSLIDGAAGVYDDDRRSTAYVLFAVFPQPLATILVGCTVELGLQWFVVLQICAPTVSKLTASMLHAVGPLARRDASICQDERICDEEIGTLSP
jgi:hypothetical protein